MTSLILIGYAIDFATADTTADFDTHERNLADSVAAYGVQGKVTSILIKSIWDRPAATAAAAAAANFFLMLSNSISLDD